MSRRRIRYALLAALVAMQLATLTAVYVWSRVRSESVLADHLTELVDGMVDGSAERTEAFAARVDGVLDLTSELVGDGVLDLEAAEVAEPYFLAVLAEHPELAGIYVGYDDGAFLFVSRTDDGFLTKDITVDGGRTVDLTERDAAQAVVGSSEDPDDPYDPRARPWFTDALAAGGSIWTEPYVFFTSELPGVTAARPLVGPDGSAAGVLGVDVALSAVGDFLDELRVAEDGRTFVVDAAGTLIAYPGGEGVTVRTDDAEGPRLRTLDEIDDPTVRAAYMAAMKDESGADVVDFSFEGASHLVRLERIAAPVGWEIGVTVPEAELVGAIRADRRDVVLAAVAAAFAVSMLAVPLIFGLTRPVDSMRRRATTDSLTALPNREELIDRAEWLVSSARRDRRPITVAMLDLDRFKAVNDRLGHAAGDDVLRAVAGRLRAQLRPGDVVGRYGGEEFTIVMPDTDVERARTVLDRLVDRLAAEEVRLEDGTAITVTVSVGVSDRGATFTELLHEADLALLRAKERGRDRVEVAAVAKDGGVSR